MTSFEFFDDECFGIEFFDNMVSFSGAPGPQVVQDGIAAYICAEIPEQKPFIAVPGTASPTPPERRPGLLRTARRRYPSNNHCRLNLRTIFGKPGQA
jgi:hypothetical protein